jgi:hypothetical protein
MNITQQEKDKYLKNQHDFYNFNLPALFEIIKECKQRTIDLLSSKNEEKKFGVRYFYAGKVDYLKMHFESMGVANGTKLTNIYRSNALLKPNSVPIFSYDLSKRKVTNGYEEFDRDYLILCEGFDLIFDIDSPKKEVMDAYTKAKEVKKILDSYKVPYYVKNSGSRGFHIIIPAQYLPKIEISLLIKTIHKVLNNFRAIHDMVEYIDLSVTNPKGLIKVSYSISEGKIISLPLNDYEFDNFNPEKTTYEYVSKFMILKNRGLFIRQHNLSEDELKKNASKFIEEYK